MLECQLRAIRNYEKKVKRILCPVEFYDKIMTIREDTGMSAMDIMRDLAERI